VQCNPCLHGRQSTPANNISFFASVSPYKFEATLSGGLDRCRDHDLILELILALEDNHGLMGALLVLDLERELEDIGSIRLQIFDSIWVFKPRLEDKGR